MLTRLDSSTLPWTPSLWVPRTSKGLVGEGGPFLGYRRRRGGPFGACGGLGMTMDTEFHGILELLELEMTF